MANFETKINNSKLKMINGMIEALKYKDFMDISVKELCVVADVNRTTFYAHYNNTMELLEDTRNYMIDKFLSSFDKTNFEEIKKGEQDTDLINETYLIKYLNLIKENKWLYVVYDKHNLAMDGEAQFKQLIDTVSKPVSRAKGSLDDVSIIYSTRFFVEGINSVVREWIKRDFKESPEYVAKIIMQSISNGK